MKKICLITLLLALVVSTSHAQENERHVPFQLSFFHPLGTNGFNGGEYTNDVSINLLLGASKNETAFTFGGLANIVKNDATGFQFAGLLNTVGNEGKGFAFAGLANTSKKYSGFQFAGLANITREDFAGFQFAGLFNCAGDVKGSQFAGLVNNAKKVSGVQFAGLVNIAEESDYPLGIVNLVKNGEKGIGLSYNDVGSTMLSFRSGGRVLYGILGTGYNHKAKDGGLTTEAGFGAHINFSPAFRINAELKSAGISVTAKKPIWHQSLTVMPAYKIGSTVELFAGPSLNFLHSEDINQTDLFKGAKLWKKYDCNNLMQVHAGFWFGVQMVF